MPAYVKAQTQEKKRKKKKERKKTFHSLWSVDLGEGTSNSWVLGGRNQQMSSKISKFPESGN